MSELCQFMSIFKKAIVNWHFPYNNLNDSFAYPGLHNDLSYGSVSTFFDFNIARHGHLCHLEHYIARVPDHFGSDLDQLLAHMHLIHVIRQHEDAGRPLRAEGSLNEEVALFRTGWGIFSILLLLEQRARRMLHRNMQFEIMIKLPSILVE